MTFREKIDKVLIIKGIKLYKLAEISGLGNTLEKAYEENRPMRDSTTDKFLQNLGIRKEWWEDEKGEVFEENSTAAIKSTGSKEKRSAEDTYRDWLESKTDYLLVPKTVLSGEYRMMLNSEIESKEKMLWQVIEAKNYAIAQLEREIAELRSGQRIMHPQKT